MNESDEHKRMREKTIETLEKKGFKYYHHEVGVRNIRLYRDYKNLEDWFKEIEIIACKDKKTIIIEIEMNPTPQHLIGTIGSINISNCYKIKEGDLKPLNDISLFIIIPEMSESTKEQIKTIKTYFKSWIGEGSLKDFEIVTIDEFDKMLQSLMIVK